MKQNERLGTPGGAEVAQVQRQQRQVLKKTKAKNLYTSSVDADDHQARDGVVDKVLSPHTVASP